MWGMEADVNQTSHDSSSNSGKPAGTPPEAGPGGAGRAKAPAALLWTAALFAFLMIALTLVLLNQPALQGSALIAIAIVVGLLPISIIAASRTGATSKIESNIEHMSRSLDQFTQEGGLSESARRVIHRREEREILRRAIEQDIQSQDWDAAMVLVKELAERFGYRHDAEEFRARIERVRAQTTDLRVVDALTRLDELIRGRNWTEAYAEAARVQRLYPDSHRVHALRERVDEARAIYRKELERGFLIAAERERVEEAMELLKELDQYLTPTEAEPYKEVARGVIGKLKENLGVRFKLTVQDQRWEEAIAVGERITSEFPNTRMAAEVRELMPKLRERVALLVR
jgi:tetratricopeptide (TPR) repeat protein